MENMTEQENRREFPSRRSVDKVAKKTSSVMIWITVGVAFANLLILIISGAVGFLVSSVKADIEETKRSVYVTECDIKDIQKNKADKVDVSENLREIKEMVKEIQHQLLRPNNYGRIIK